MDLGASFLSLSRAIAYKINSLTERSFQEVGVSPLNTYALHRYALIPVALWIVVFVRPDDIGYILSSTHLLVYILITVVIWNAQQFAHSYIINTSSSVSALSNLYNILILPLLLLVGVAFNKDTPSFLSVVSIVILVVALMIKPAHHEENNRERFSKPLIFIAFIILVQAVADAFIIGIYREVLKELSPEIVIGVFSAAVLLGCVLCVALFAPRQKNQQATVVRKYPFRALSIPALWFVGTIPEMYAYTALPIYIVLAIGSITFIMDIFSDLRQRRISFNLQTISFIVLVFAGISLAAFSM